MRDVFDGLRPVLTTFHTHNDLKVRRDGPMRAANAIVSEVLGQALQLGRIEEELGRRLRRPGMDATNVNNAMLRVTAGPNANRAI